MKIDTDLTQLWEALHDTVKKERQVPTTTYRVQFNRLFTFRDATTLVPYWKALGISHVYASPYFEARPESMHGYDICNHNALNPSIGSEDDYAMFVQTLHDHGMGQILDTVPNHMGIGESGNEYWMDVLENGPSSPYATFFDIDWQPLKQEMANQVLLPILGAQYGQVLENQELRLAYHNGAFFLHYWETQLPIAPRTYAAILQIALETVLETRAADDEHVLELQSIMTALSYLPPRTETDPDQIAERQREKEIIKRRLNALTEASTDIAQAIEGAVQTLNGVKGDPRSFDQLDELVRAQAFRLAYWRVAAEEINYRRFFDINELAAIRMEQPVVFEATHRLLMQLLADGSVNGLRIDHPDGLWDPAGYFANLQRYYLLALARKHFDGDDEQWEEAKAEIIARYDQALGDDPHSFMARPLYVVVEKILGHNEALPATWPVDGTSGYEFLNLVNGLFIESGNAKAFDDLYSKFIQERTRFNELVLNKKKQIMLVSLTSELNVLAHQLNRLAEGNRHVRDFTLNSLTFALREVIACFPIYRTYIADGTVPPEAVPYIEEAIRCAKRRNPVTDVSVFDFIRDVLLLQYPAYADEDYQRAQQDWVQKFQQVTGPVMAKGLEDTTFYIYNRLISLNEVGGEPLHFGTSASEFHRANTKRLDNWPHTMLTTSTHDTKRSEDVRARINVLSEIPREWKAAVSRWHRLNRRHKTKVEGRSAPDRNEEYLFYQTLLGAWPHEPMDNETHATFIARMQEYMQKAMKEAKVNTSWINPNEAWDTAVRTFVARVLDDSPNNQFLADLLEFATKTAHFGAFNSLAQTLFKLTVPGVPDIYQGNETWDLSLVDPDNRRPIDYKRNAALLASLSPNVDNPKCDQARFVRDMVEQKENGCIKLYLTSRTLRFRRDHADLFATGTYQPLESSGPHADHVVAFARRHDDMEVIVAAPRLLTAIVRDLDVPLGGVWNGNLLVIDSEPGTTYTNVYTGERLEIRDYDGSTGIAVADLFANMPVALLVRE